MKSHSRYRPSHITIALTLKPPFFLNSKISPKANPIHPSTRLCRPTLTHATIRAEYPSNIFGVRDPCFSPSSIRRSCDPTTDKVRPCPWCSSRKSGPGLFASAIGAERDRSAWSGSGSRAKDADDPHGPSQGCMCGDYVIRRGFGEARGEGLKDGFDRWVFTGTGALSSCNRFYADLLQDYPPKQNLDVGSW